MPLNWQPGTEPVAGYRLIDKLGKGGFGEVWKARGPGGFHVALKGVPLDEEAGGGEMRALDVIREIRHPQLIATFGTWQVDQTLVIAMELADRTLMDRFRESAGQGLPGIPAPEVFEHFLDAARALDYLNEPRHAGESGGLQGIQHRDIKPQNLLILGGSVKVADYGLARVLEGTQTSHTGSMTPLYAAPEFFDGRTSSQSDQYSLAATYCHMRGGRPPYSGTKFEIMGGHLTRPPDLTMLPEAERAAVGRALSKNPKDRWPSCRAFVEAVRNARSEAPEPAPKRMEPDIDLPTRPYGLPTPPPPRPEGGQVLGWRTGLAMAASLAVVVGLSLWVSGTLIEEEKPTVPKPDFARGTAPNSQAVPSTALGPGANAKGGAPVEAPKLGAGRPGPKPEDTPKSAPPPAATPKEAPKDLPPPAPALALHLPETLRIASGETKPLKISAVRSNLTGPIAVSLAGLPSGSKPETATIPESEESVTIQVAIPKTTTPGDHAVRFEGRAGAITATRSATLTVTASAASHIDRGLALRGERNHDGAIAEFAKAIEIEPRNARAYYERGYSWDDKQENDKAIADFDEAIKLDPKDAKAYGFRGKSKSSKGDLDGAIADYGEAIKLAPKDTLAYRLRSIAWAAKEEYAKAIADLDEAIRLDPQDGYYYTRRADVKVSKGDLDGAIADLDEAIKLAPKHGYYYTRRGEVKVSKGNLDGAIADFDEAIKLEPKHAYNSYVRGQAWAAKKEYAKAIADLDEAIKLEPKEAYYYECRSAAHRAKGDAKRADEDRDAAERLKAAK